MSAQWSKTAGSLAVLILCTILGAHLLSAPVFVLLHLLLNLASMTHRTEDDIRTMAILVSLISGALIGAYLGSLLTARIRRGPSTVQPPTRRDGRFTTRRSASLAGLHAVLVISTLTVVGGVLGLSVGVQLANIFARGTKTQELIMVLSLTIGASVGGLAASVVTANMRRIARTGRHIPPDKSAAPTNELPH